MKTYLLDILNKYQRFSERLDIETILCNKAWLIFNDTGNKEVYIFQEKGNLLVSVNGEVSNAAWQYVPANKSLIISSDGHSYMFRPSFIDNIVFALQQDGTKKFAFMINEEQSEFFHPKSLVELELYFEEQLQKRIEAEMQATQSVIKKEQEARSVLLMDEAEDLWDKEGKEILKADLTYKQLCKRCNVVGMLLSLLVLCCFITAILLDSSYVMLLGFVGLFIVFFVIHFPKEMYRKNKAEEYIDLYIKERL